MDDVEGVMTTAVEEIVRVASPVTFMRRTATTDVTVSGHDFAGGTRSSCSTARPTGILGCSTTPSGSTPTAS